MRIVGGKYKGHRITAPSGMETRPTTDRTRESLFNILHNRIDFHGIRVADLFAGSGALGLEAISRGAGFCMFADLGRKQCETIQQNIKALQLGDQTQVICGDVTKSVFIRGLKEVDLVFADPPYGKGLGEKLAASLSKERCLEPGSLFVLEESKVAFPDHLASFSEVLRREYGETTIGLFEVMGA